MAMVSSSCVGHPLSKEQALGAELGDGAEEAAPSMCQLMCQHPRVFPELCRNGGRSGFGPQTNWLSPVILVGSHWEIVSRTVMRADTV
jgi:hypothetical protein